MPKATINDYAQSMFRFERLHPRWIDACANYLKHIFGSNLEGKIFLDYAFGRGNWSLAALKAGARGVVAVDAAEANIARFSAICRQEEINKIKILHANIMEAPIPEEVDLIWVYGILPAIEVPKQPTFLQRLTEMRRDDSALALLYQYDRHSFRQHVVDAAREGHVYESEQEFGEDTTLFTPSARMRARDDLTAPVVEWATVDELASLASGVGLHPKQQFTDFSQWGSGKPNFEFSPHHILCGLSETAAYRFKEPERPDAADFKIISELAHHVFRHASVEHKRKLAIGLFNTHFSALTTGNAVEFAVREDFLFLIHAMMRLEIASANLPSPAKIFFDAAMAAMTDQARTFSQKDFGGSSLANYLQSNTVRF
jgi:hypothetical protein